MDISVDLLQWSISFLIKKFASLVDKCTNSGTVKSENISTKELAE